MYATPWQAMAGPPGRFLRSAWPWRSLGYLAGGVVSGIACLALLLFLGAIGVLLSPILVGLALLVGLCLSGVAIGALERRRLRLVLPEAATDPHQAPPARGGWSWVTTRLREPITWRELGFVALSGSILWVAELVVVCSTLLLSGFTLLGPLVVILAPPGAVPAGAAALNSGWLWLNPVLGVVIAAVSPYAWAAAAGARAALARSMLTTADHAGLAEVRRSRSRLVDRFDVERGRIERDLHDGVQRQLLALSMQLGLARSRLASGVPEPAIGSLVVSAHEQAKAALDEIQALVNGIQPQVLNARGISAAIAEIAASSTLPVHAETELPGRFDRAVESCVYYTVSEAVTNANKHSRATLVRVTANFDGRTLGVDVTDDGVGGADAVPGGGLEGLADRAETFGGRLRLSSPAGGPTVLRLDVPCRPAGH